MKNTCFKKIADVFEINPPKKLAREKLNNEELVSFLPMEDLGILTKDISAKKVRSLKSVIGSYTYFEDDDVLLAKITPCFENGKLGIASGLKNGVGFGSSEYLVFRGKGDISPEFLFYYFMQDCFRREGAQRMTGAVGHKRVTKEFIENCIVYCPPLPEQHRITAILDKAFADIEKAKENVERNLENTKLLFNSTLTQILSHGDNLWEKTNVEELILKNVLFKISDGNHGEIHPTRKDFVPTGVPFIMASDLKDGKVDLYKCRFIKESQAKKLRVGFARDQDIILSHKATIGRVAILTTDKDYIILTPQVTYYRIKDTTKLFNRYLYYFFLSSQFQKEIYDYAKGGATRAYIGITKQLKLNIVIPPLPTQHAIVTKLDALSAKTKDLQQIYKQKLANLEELKKSILNKAFNGEL